MSRGGGDYRDAFREGAGTYAEQEMGERAFVAGHSAPLRDFVDAFLTSKNNRGGGGDDGGGDGGGCAGGGDGPDGVVAYLAQHDLLAQIPELADACSPTPPYVGREVKCSYDREGEAAMSRVWLGPAGTISPLHRDPYHNVLCQVWGSKLVRMYRAEDSARMYPFPGGFLRNTSRVDAESPDADRFPLFDSTPRWEVILMPGDMLFLPAKTWHYVRATAPSLSVSYWWGR